MKKGPGFQPSEIIFAVTDNCNLHCKHCYVPRHTRTLSAQAAISFLETLKSAENPQAAEITKIGFSGGEPFLYPDFLCQLIEFGCKNDFLFDRIMTNGIWWKDEQELNQILQKIYDSGYDGKIGLSFDSFHNQPLEKIKTFISAVHNIWNDSQIVEIQSVCSHNEENNKKDLIYIEEIASFFNCSTENYLNKKGFGQILIQSEDVYIPVYRTPQSFTADNINAWSSKKWFKDDFCEGPGQILYVHPDGNIAPCCGFANEEPALIIGNINQSFDSIIQQAKQNKMIQICYEEGLEKQIEVLKNKGEKFMGKCDDLCAFCQLVARRLNEN